MPNKTQNYQLNQYLPQDNFLRTDFNGDNAKIDAALAGLNASKAEVFFGTYAGNDSTSSGVAQHIELGFSPKAILVTTDNYIYGGYCGMFGKGFPTKHANGVVTDTGFAVKNTYNTSFNSKGMIYFYMALK